MVQGFLEQSNVNPIAEMARMIEVQRAYEYGQKLMDQEDERIRQVVRTLGQRPEPQRLRRVTCVH